MDFFLLLIFAGAIAYLWRRTDGLEQRLRDMEAQQVPASRYSAQDLEPARPEAVAANRIDAEPEPKPEAEPEPQVSVVPEEPIEKPAQEKEVYAANSQAASAGGSFNWVRQRRDQISRGFTKPKLDFEQIFGRLLPIWAGGITLAIAGFFLVRYSIESGLLTPPVRVLLSFLFGAGLIGAAEVAYRKEDVISDPRVRQALAGAGLATLYAAFYLAGTMYGLIGSGLAFAGLAAVTAGAIALSYRFGLPSAVLGLVGGFAAPALISSSEPNLPVLAAYLGLVTAGISLTGKRQGHAWLSLTALGAALGWGWLMLASIPADVPGVLATGLLIVAAGVVLPSLKNLTGVQSVFRLVGAAMAAVQIAVLVNLSDHGLLAWGLLGLLAAALAFFGWADTHMRQGSAMAAAVTLIMLALWFDPQPVQFALVSVLAAIIFAGASLAHIWRGQRELVDLALLAAFPVGLAAIAMMQFAAPAIDWPQPLLAAAIAVLAAIPAIAAWRIWPGADEKLDLPLLGLIASATITAFAGGLLLVPLWLTPIVPAVISAILFLLVKARQNAGLNNIALAAAIAGLVTLFASSADIEFMEAIAGYDEQSQPLRESLRFLLGIVPWALVAFGDVRRIPRAIAEVFAVSVTYGLLAQFVPFTVLPAVIAVCLGILAWQLPRRAAALVAGIIIAAGWALWPTAQWLMAGGEALAGVPFLVGDALSMREVAIRIVPLAGLLGLMAWLQTAKTLRMRSITWAVMGTLAAVTVHSAFKLIFGLDSDAAFTALGLAERTVWQAVLLAPALALLARQKQSDGWKVAGFVSAVISLAYFLVFTFLLHNPLLQAQAAGTLPVLNLLLPAYGLAAAALYAVGRFVPQRLVLPRVVGDAGMMVLITIFALSWLRHAFAGSILTDPAIGPTEDLLRSLLGIVLAIGFLAWGGRTGTRSWRLGSLVLMLLAILKVFLLDAAGLEGLWRIASFMALGFSLIGIGWFYSRQLLRLEPQGEVGSPDEQQSVVDG